MKKYSTPPNTAVSKGCISCIVWDARVIIMTSFSLAMVIASKL